MSIKAIYGVASLGLRPLVICLSSVSGGCAVVVNNDIQKVGTLSPVPSVIFFTVRQFLKHNARIKKDYVAFIVDVPEELDQISGLLSLGYVRLKSGNYEYTDISSSDIQGALDLAKPRKETVWSHKAIDRLYSLIVEDKTGEALSKIRTLLYTVPNKEVRALCQKKVINNLIGKSGLKKTTSFLSGYLSSGMLDKLTTILKSKECAELRASYAKFKARPSMIEVISKKHSVSTFVLRYLASQEKK